MVPSIMDHTLIVLSPEPEKSVPSNPTANAETTSSWPVKVRMWVCPGVDHTRIVPLPDPE